MCFDPFGPFINSHDRLDAFLDYMLKCIRVDKTIPKPEEFWRIFIDMWPCCDATWHCRQSVRFWLTFYNKRRPGSLALEGEDRQFYDNLPDLIPIFRGCSSERVRGVSWTTDRRVAEGFARGYRGPRHLNPVVAQAMIPKEAVYVSLMERQEYEVIIDTRRLRKLQMQPYKKESAA